MATLYLDFENGNDNYAGTSFALLAQGTDGRIASTTFSSATASFPNDGSLIGQYLSIFNGTIYAVYIINAWVSSTSLTISALVGGTALANQAVDRQYYIGGRWKTITNGASNIRANPSDIIRIMGSPAPTSLGQNGVWTSQTLQATKNITSSTNATPITINLNAHGYSTGDTVVITGHTTNTNANGTWEITNTGANSFRLDGSVGNGTGGATGTVRLRNNSRVKLATAVTQNIASTGPGRTAWIASANVSATLETQTALFKEHQYSDAINITAAFTTGKAAYYTLPSELNLSAYQQVSFLVVTQSFATIAAGEFTLRLCSDTLGDVAVNTIAIPANPSTERWTPFTIDTGASLGASIKSIALYVESDLGAKIIRFNNIIACKASSAADSLTLTSLIGKNTAGEAWWAIQSINGTRVMLDSDSQGTPITATLRGYYGTSGTVTTWKRETIKLGPSASSSTAVNSLSESGTLGNPITYSGGWDRTNMTTQSLQTWLDGLNGFGYAISAGARTAVSFINLAFVRFDRGLTFNSAADVIVSGFSASSCGYGYYGTGAHTGVTFGIESIIACTNNSFAIDGACASVLISCTGSLVSGSPLSVPTSQGITIDGGLYANQSPSGLSPNTNAVIGSEWTIKNARIVDNGTSSISIQGLGAARIAKTYLSNCLLGDTVEVSGLAAGQNNIVYSHNHDQTPNNHKIFFDTSLISSATDQRRTLSGISWKIQPTDNLRSALNPMFLSLAKVAVSASNLVTIKAWMRRDSSGLTMRLVCKGGQIAGVPTDVASFVTTTNAWEEETITFTPTEAGVVEILAEAWGGSVHSGWVDDMTISQA